jgi:LuxR family maltose regulon positive regulatory protein
MQQEGAFLQDIVITKLSLPPIEKDIVARPRLLQLATEITSRKLTLLTAPAGYGKTVLMVQLVKAILKPSTWCQLDSYDNDFMVFIKYLITGIRITYPDFGKEAVKLTELGEANTQQRLLVASIINDLAAFAPNGLVIVLDDFHVITEPTIYDFIQEILSYLPGGIHFMIASRSIMPFPVDRLKLTGDLLAIEADSLRFRPEEVATFFAQKDQAIPEKTAETLTSNIFGWPVALRLMKNPCPEETQTLSYDDHQAIYDYLATAIYTKLPKPVQSFLVATSILDVFTAEFCNTLLERTDADQILHYLENQQLFLISLIGTVKSFRYHDLFRDFLQAKLSVERKKLLYKAAEITYQTGNPVQSCEYLLKAGVTDAHIPVLVEAGRKALECGQWKTVARWLKGLTGEQIQANSWLSYFQAQVELYQNRPEQAERWAKISAALFIAGRDHLGLLEANILKAKLLRCYGRYQQSFELLQQVASEIPLEQLRNRVDLYMEMYVVSCLTGRLKEGEAILTQGLELITPWKDGYIESHFYEGLGTINYMLGNYPKALQMYKHGAEASPDRRLPSYYAQDNVGSIYGDWGELDQALGYGNRNVEIKEKLNLYETLPSAYYYLAGIHVDRGEFDLAENLYRKAIMMVKANNNDRFAHSTILVFLARCLSLQGKLTEGLKLVEEALQEAEAQSGLAWAISREIGSLVLISAGEIEKAEKMLLEAITALKEMGFQKSVCDCGAALATIYCLKKDLEKAEQYTRESLGIASRLNLIQMFVTQYGLMQPVLRMGLEKDIEVTFIQRVLARLGDRSLPFLAALAVNPEPAIRLRTILPLTEIGTSRAKAIMKDLIHDPNPEVFEIANRLSKTGDSPVSSSGALISTCDRPVMELMMLGNFRVFINSAEISPMSWRAVKVRDLLAYLTHRTEPVSTPQILDDLWPQFDREKAAANFHTTLYQLRYRLRQACDANLVFYGGQRYFVKPDSFISDRHRYEKLIVSALKKDLSPETVANLEQALGMYQGDYLADLDYEWVIPLQEHLKRLCLEARIALSRHYLENNGFNLAIGHLRSAQALNPLHEEIYCLLMTANAGKGDRQAVMEEYEQLKTVLKKELGLEPSKSSTELYYRLYK